MLEGVIRRQFKCINIDPYANAFNDGAVGGEWMSDLTDMKPELHERKWEIDSLCYPLRLAYQYWKETGDASIFDSEWIQAITNILSTFKEQQRKEGVGPYKFQRKTERALDTLNNNGLGAPVNPVGLIVSAFRPSDDATTLQFLVPSNFFAVSSLKKAAEILNTVNQNAEMAKQCTDLAKEVETALKKYATYNHPKYGTIYAFEVDGFGNHFLMDDANVPSLLAMPYLGDVDINDPIYQNTRRFVWSKDNPYFFKGKAGEGIGGPHIGYDMVWPMSIMMKAFTSQDSQLQGVAEKKGELIVPIEYDEILTGTEKESSGYFLVVKDGKAGYIRKDGEVTVKPDTYVFSWNEDGEAPAGENIVSYEKMGFIYREANKSYTLVAADGTITTGFQEKPEDLEVYLGGNRYW